MLRLESLAQEQPYPSPQSMLIFSTLESVPIIMFQLIRYLNFTIKIIIIIQA